MVSIEKQPDGTFTIEGLSPEQLQAIATHCNASDADTNNVELEIMETIEDTLFCEVLRLRHGK